MGSYSRGGVIQQGWGHTAGAGSYSRGGVIQQGWGHTAGVGSYSRGGVIQQGWGHTAGAGSYSRGGVIQQGWGHTAGVGSYSRGGVIQQGWGHTAGVGSYSRGGVTVRVYARTDFLISFTKMSLNWVIASLVTQLDSHACDSHMTTYFLQPHPSIRLAEMDPVGPRTHSREAFGRIWKVSQSEILLSLVAMPSGNLRF